MLHSEDLFEMMIFLRRLVKTGKPCKQKHSQVEFVFNFSDCEQLSIFLLSYTHEFQKQEKNKHSNFTTFSSCVNLTSNR